jgi:hypothetical protein
VGAWRTASKGQEPDIWASYAGTSRFRFGPVPGLLLPPSQPGSHLAPGLYRYVGLLNSRTYEPAGRPN